MTNSMKVPLKNGSGSGSNGFLKDAPRTSLRSEDPAIRCDLNHSIAMQLQGYRGLHAVQEERLRSYRTSLEQERLSVVENWGGVMELCKKQRFYI